MLDRKFAASVCLSGKWSGCLKTLILPVGSLFSSQCLVWALESVKACVTCRTKSSSQYCVPDTILGCSLVHLFVYDDVDLDATLSSREQHAIKSVLLVLCRRPSQVQLRAEPPVQDPDSVSGILKGHADSPHVRAAVDIPLGVVTLTLWRKGLEAVHMVLVAIRALGRGMSVGVYVSLVGLLRLSFGVATTYGLLDSSLDIAECLLGLIEQERHLCGFLERWVGGSWGIFCLGCCYPACATLRLPERVCALIAVFQAVVLSEWYDALLADIPRMCFGK